MKLIDALLWLPTVLYEASSRFRNAAYDRKVLTPNRLSCVVISVGNLTVGGTGKTPMVLWIAQRLLAEGKKVGILTRGYRGGSQLGDSSDGSVPTSTGASSAGSSSTGNSSSDEVQMLAKRLGRLGGQVAFGVGPNRFARGRELAARGIDWFVLDDGFQHRQLARDVDIVLIDATNPFGGGHLLPSGRLREPRSGLSRADIIVITRSEHSPAIEAAVQHDSSAPIFYARPYLESVHSINSDVAAPRDLSADPAIRTQKLFAFCGIGNPSAFLADLRDWVFQVAGQKFYRDHHRYTLRDLHEIQAEASSAGASRLICTEKDIFNLPRDLLRVSSQDSLPILYCRISMRIDRADEFWRAILAKSGSRA